MPTLRSLFRVNNGSAGCVGVCALSEAMARLQINCKAHLRLVAHRFRWEIDDQETAQPLHLEQSLVQCWW